MSVPAHDQRDFEFARKYGLPVRVVIQPEGPALDGATLTASYEGPGKVVNSGEWNGLDAAAAIPRMAKHAASRASARPVVTYRLKDWLISRQRYWGTPIPVVYCDKDGMQARARRGAADRVCPRTRPFTGEGGQPLAKVAAFVNAAVRSAAARPARDGHHGHLRGLVLVLLPLSLADKSGRPVDPAAVRYWFPIDLYVGGIEHAILHLVYSRFWTKVDARPRPRLVRRARAASLPAGDGPQGGRGDVEVQGKHRGSRTMWIGSYGADTLRLYVLGEGSGGDGPRVERGAHLWLVPPHSTGLASVWTAMPRPSPLRPGAISPPTRPVPRETCGGRRIRRSRR
jgi:leucyl-tRNA synthetase